MGNLDIAEKRVPQDGRISLRVGGAYVDLRIAVLPTIHGEHATLRIFNHSRAAFALDDVGMPPDVLDRFGLLIHRPYGAVITAGPTNSGRTTTLYAALDALDEESRVLVTIEGPVEHQRRSINQVEVDLRAGLTFSRALRTLLRSDPDVLLVGEIRDEETARIAMRASLTDHLLLTTLHAPNAVGALTRLKEMGIAPSAISTAVS